MLKTLKKSLFVALFMLCGSAHAELPQDYKVVLLTENFPPFNMAVDDKNLPVTTASMASVPTSYAKCSSVPASITP